MRRLRISVKSGWSVNQLLFLGSPSLASFSGVALAVGGAQVGDGEFGVVFEGVEGFVAEEILDMVIVGDRSGYQPDARLSGAIDNICLRDERTHLISRSCNLPSCRVIKLFDKVANSGLTHVSLSKPASFH